MTQFLKDTSEYLTSIELNDPDGMIKDEKFIDEMTEQHNLDEESEATLCVAISFLRSIAVLIEERK